MPGLRQANRLAFFIYYSLYPPISVNWTRRLLAALISIVFIATQTAEAGPFADFFRKVRRTFNHADQKSRPHKSAGKESNQTPPKDGETSADNSTTTAPPNEANTRAAKAALIKKASGSDVPYGSPVPGKKGFVTSPFAPESGYVDVRGFPPGSEVKDPYTGKIFRTP